MDQLFTNNSWEFVNPPNQKPHSLSLGAQNLSGFPSPLEILASAQPGRFVIQEFTPLSDSIEWEMGQRYLHERGNKAFIIDPEPVPFIVNNDGNLSLNAANLFFTSLISADQEGILEKNIFVLELGIGVGLFARFFLDTFRDLCDKKGKDYYHRLCYVAADRSAQMLLDACRHGIFTNHPGRYLLRVVDALCPERDLPKDPVFGELAPSPFRAIFLNYLLDCLPAAVLKIKGEKVQQLHVRTCLARGANLTEYTDLTTDELAAYANSPHPKDQGKLLKVFGLLASEYDYRPVDQAKVPYSASALKFAQGIGHDSVLHNYGAIQSLERLINLVGENGFILINDYGPTDPAATEDFQHQRFSHATFIGVNFPLLENYFSQTNRATWAKPQEENPNIHSRLLGIKLKPETVNEFQERFSKANLDWLQKPVQDARQCIQSGRLETALEGYLQALQRQPYNWVLMNEAALFLTFQLRNPTAGLEMAKAALSYNPTCSPDLWNTLGDCFFALGRIEEAQKAFRKALRINENDVRARFNLVFVYIQTKNYPLALQMVAEGLALDKPGTYRERFLQKQSEVLAHLSQRHRQEFQRMADRISHQTNTNQMEGPKENDEIRNKFVQTPAPPSHMTDRRQTK